MTKDYVTEDEWEGFDMVEASDCYSETALADDPDAEDFGLSARDKAFMMGYLDAEA
jgi:hypothetical protein